MYIWIRMWHSCRSECWFVHFTVGNALTFRMQCNLCTQLCVYVVYMGIVNYAWLGCRELVMSIVQSIWRHAIMQVPLLIPKGPCRVELYPIWDSSIFCKSFSTLEWRGAAIVPKEHAPLIEAHHWPRPLYAVLLQIDCSQILPHSHNILVCIMTICIYLKLYILQACCHPW